MTDTALLGLPLIAANQAQKHVTHNTALRMLDSIVQLSAKSRLLTAPPVGPGNGDRWIVGPAPTGAWSGKAGQIAAWVDGAWAFFVPETGWNCFVENEGVLTYAGGAWAAALALGLHGASSGLVVSEEEVTLAGASTDTTIVIPNRAIALAVSVRTTVLITGATSFNCGVAGDLSKFGGTLGITLGANNIGVIGPTAYYADTPIRLTAVGSNFTGGKVRVAIHTLSFAASAS